MLYLLFYIELPLTNSSSPISKITQLRITCMLLPNTHKYSIANLDRRLSTPRTKYSPKPINTVPLYGLSLMKQVIGGMFPELAEIGFTDSRVGFTHYHVLLPY